MGPTTIHIQTEKMGKILTDIFETNDTVKTNVLGFRNNNFSYDIQLYISNDQVITDNLLAKKE
jgi:hypothetical protein